MDKDLREILLPMLQRRFPLTMQEFSETPEGVSEAALSLIPGELLDPVTRFAAASHVFSLGPAAATSEILEALKQALIAAREPEEVQILLEAVGVCGAAAVGTSGLLEAVSRAMLVGEAGVRKTATSILTLLPWQTDAPLRTREEVQQALLQIAGDISTGSSAARWALAAVVPLHRDPDIQAALEQIAARWPEESEVRADAESLLTLSPTVWDKVRDWMTVRQTSPLVGHAATKKSKPPTGEVVATELLDDFEVHYFQEEDLFWARIIAGEEALGSVVRFEVVGSHERPGFTILQDTRDVFRPAGYVVLRSSEERIERLEEISPDDITSEDLSLLREALLNPSMRSIEGMMNAWERWLRSMPRHLEADLLRVWEIVSSS